MWSRQALEWRLRGLIGVEPLADRLARDVASADGQIDEALLVLADLLLVLCDVDYRPLDGALPRETFDELYRAFLTDLAGRLKSEVESHRGRISSDVMQFWNRVVQRCSQAERDAYLEAGANTNR